MQKTPHVRLVYGVFLPFEEQHQQALCHDIKEMVNRSAQPINAYGTKILFKHSTPSDILLAMLISGELPATGTLTLDTGLLKIHAIEKKTSKTTMKNTMSLSDTARRKQLRKGNNPVLTEKNWKQFINKHTALTGLRWSRDKHGTIQRTYAPLKPYQINTLSISTHK